MEEIGLPRRSALMQAWGLTLAPIVLFIPAMMLAGMGPCSYAHPFVMVAALALFVMLEVAAVPRFVRGARRAGRSISAIFGIALAFCLLVLSLAFEFLTVTDYL
jgi:hypothetical protein